MDDSGYSICRSNSGIWLINKQSEGEMVGSVCYALGLVGISGNGRGHCILDIPKYIHRVTFVVPPYYAGIV